MSDMDGLKETELFGLLEIPVQDRSIEIGHFLAKHYSDDPTLVRISEYLITEPKMAKNSLHLKGVSSLDLWRDVMIGSSVKWEGMDLNEAIRAQVDLENRDDPSAKASEKSVKGSIARVRKANQVRNKKE